MTAASVSVETGKADGAASGSGLRILFFSGGTALRECSRELARFSRNTVHLVTPFDSGGSSATLRRSFAMPAVGDARSRIMALAEDGREGNAEIFTLFAYRLPEDESSRDLIAELARMVRGSHPLLRQVPEPANAVIREHLAWFALHMPLDFPLRGANIGNMVLTAGYLRSNRRLAPVLALFSRLVRARGLVRTVVEDSLHLAVRLASGKVIVGQHKFTGKSICRIDSPITDIWLTGSENSEAPVTPAISQRTAKLISGAAAICYPVGSFYSSVVANLLPKGVGRAVAENPGPKIFVPNLGADPELLGVSLEEQVDRLLLPLLTDANGAKPTDVLTCLLVDRENGDYPGGLPESRLAALGIKLVHAPLVRKEKSPLARPRPLAEGIWQIAVSGV